MPDANRENSGRRYETRDVRARNMVYSAMGLAVLMVIGLVSSWLVMRYFVRVQPLGPPASPFDNTRELPPQPRLQVSPVQDLEVYKAMEERKLESYGWVDKDAGIVRIPIERAMALSLERGFPVRGSQAPQNHQATASRVNSPGAADSSPSEMVFSKRNRENSAP